jgi:hypothetical protein
LIGGLSEESCKIAEVQTLAILGLFLESFRTKNHLDIGVAERPKKYYMGKGGGFPEVWAVVSLVSPRSPMACHSTKGAPNNVVTNLLVSLMKIQVNN